MRQGFQTLEFHPQVMRRSTESQGAPRSWVLAPCPLQGPILQASPTGGHLLLELGHLETRTIQQLNKHRGKTVAGGELECKSQIWPLASPQWRWAPACPVFECQGWTLSLRMKLALQMVTFFNTTDLGKPF